MDKKEVKEIVGNNIEKLKNDNFSFSTTYTKDWNLILKVSIKKDKRKAEYLDEIIDSKIENIKIIKELYMNIYKEILEKNHSLLTKENMNLIKVKMKEINSFFDYAISKLNDRKIKWNYFKSLWIDFSTQEFDKYVKDIKKIFSNVNLYFYLNINTNYINNKFFETIYKEDYK